MSGSTFGQEILASLQGSTETETEFGGRTRVWTEIATVWVVLTPAGTTSDTGQDQRPFRVETATAAARDHPLAVTGEQLVTDDALWRVLAVQRTEPGRMTLLLDRAL